MKLEVVTDKLTLNNKNLGVDILIWLDLKAEMVHFPLRNGNWQSMRVTNTVNLNITFLDLY